jgi:hypothetical protein
LWIDCNFGVDFNEIVLFARLCFLCSPVEVISILISVYLILGIILVSCDLSWGMLELWT